MFSPSNNYSATKRPYVFVMGNAGQSALEAYEADSLKDVPRFYNYLFVYAPNVGTRSSEKLDCLNALASHVTWNYTCGKKNVFLSIYDPSVTPADTTSNNLKESFHSIHLNQAQDNLSSTPTRIEDDFKEDVKAYDQLEGNEDENLGTFYFEEDKKTTEDETSQHNPYANKTYYGPPQSKDFTLSGLVKDKSTGEALPFATIHLRGSTKAISTNADGYFTLSKVPTDTSVLIISYVGYAKTEVYLTPFISRKNLIIEVSSAGNQLKTVTIVAAREEVVLAKQEEVSVIKITPKELEKLPNIGEKDVMRSFQLMPGVSASQESSSGLYVRGGTPDQNLVLYDGFTVYHVDHLYGFFSAFNANAVKDVQLYKGGFESKFGGRLSSVTEITGKDGNQKKINIGGDLSLLSANVFAEIPIGDKFSSVIAFRRSYKGPIYNKLVEKYSKSSSSAATTQQGTGGPGGGRFSQNTVAKSYFYDLNGKFTYRPTQKDIIALSIFNGTDKFDNSVDNSNLPSFGGGTSNFSFSSTDLTKYGNIGTSLKWSRKWAPRFYGNTLISYSNFYSDRDRSQQRTVTDASGNESTTKNGIFENNDLKDYSLKSDYQWEMFEMSQLQFGVFGTNYDIKYTYAQNDTSTVLDKSNKTILAGGYVQNKFKLLKNKLIFVPGIRASYYGITKQNYFEPRASLSLKLTKQLTLKGATGKYFQFANRVTREDILSGNKEFWLLSDGKDVPVSSSLHYIAGLSFETTHLLFSAEAYYKKIQNLTEYSLRFNSSPAGTDVDENFYTGNGYARGIEFLMQKKTGKFNGWVSYTLGEARNHFSVYADGYFPANQDVSHEFKIVTLYKWRRWDFSATWVYATGRPYTAPSGAYNVTLLDGSTQDFFTVTTKNGLRLPEYHRADISANYKLLKGSKGDKKRREVGYLSFSIFNVYNRTNVWYKTYSIESGSVIETNVNYTSITPNITLSLKLR
ncbi:TonB-dependent receptor [Sphingobacteriaceae bacterium]|nr:TonB-dependent receptor [Sphingobacteriaceae bacterium]